MLYKDENTSVDMKEMIRLWHIPEVQQVIEKETQRLMRGEIGHEAEKFGEFRNMYFKEMVEKETDTEGSLYWFELFRYNEGEWRIVNIKPMPPQGIQPYDLLDWELIRQITEEYPVKPEAVMEIIPHDLGGQKNRVRFVRHSNSAVFGTYRLIKKTIMAVPVKEVTNGAKEKEVSEVEIEIDESQSFRTIYKFLHQHPQEGEAFIRTYLQRQLPGVRKLEAGNVK
jgi:hypothetical protein